MGLFKAIVMFSLSGFGVEVIFTGVIAGIKGKRQVVDHDNPWMAYSSPLYIPTYTTIAFFFVYAGPTVFTYHVLVRFVVYSIYAFAMEYLQNTLLKAIFGKAPSQKKYSQSKWNIHEMVIVYYAPFFGIAGLIFEWLYRG